MKKDLFGTFLILFLTVLVVDSTLLIWFTIKQENKQNRECQEKGGEVVNMTKQMDLCLKPGTLVK